MFLNRNALALGTEEQHPEVTKFKITIYKNHRIRMIQAGTPITTNRSKITFQLDGTWPNVCLGRGAELCSVEQMVLQMQHTVPKCAMFRSWIEFKHPGDDLVSWHILAQRVTTLPTLPTATDATVDRGWRQLVGICGCHRGRYAIEAKELMKNQSKQLSS